MSNEKRNRPDIRLRSKSYRYQRYYIILSLPLIRHKTKIEWCNSKLLERNLSLTTGRVRYSFARGRKRQQDIYLSLFTSRRWPKWHATHTRRSFVCVSPSPRAAKWSKLWTLLGAPELEPALPTYLSWYTKMSWRKEFAFMIFMLAPVLQTRRRGPSQQCVEGMAHTRKEPYTCPLDSSASIEQ